MNTALILLIILFLLMFIVGGKLGLRSFFTLIFNFISLILMTILISINFSPIKITLIFCTIISIITLFYINGINKKSLSALISVLIVVVLTLLITYKIGSNAKIQGFGNEHAEDLAFLSLYINIDFSKIIFCEILIGLLGAIIDVSISISSSLYEIHKNNKFISKYNLFMSGMNIGSDILGSMTNTLFFAYIAGFMTLIIYFNELNYSLTSILNSKVFCTEIFQSLCGGIGVILIIPITSFVTSEILNSNFVIKFSRKINL
ncbi:YibE/F family protein [Haloimpatiens sp. FM7315]|uniref:YibE/F family protein n=1 Tax=Haloimpatiens sp. FM7315 TaxID=3298609 RepID=UPI00370A6383